MYYPGVQTADKNHNIPIQSTNPPTNFLWSEKLFHQMIFYFKLLLPAKIWKSSY